MAYKPNPNDPYRTNPADDPYRANDPYRPNDPYRADEYRDAARLDNDLQADPELAEGRASGGKIAMFAIAVALILGAVFYGLNNSSIEHAGTAPTAQNTTQSSPPATPPGMRDVTPRPNNDQGVTTGAAPARPAQPPPPAAPAPSK
jgi:hypothetical protein